MMESSEQNSGENSGCRAGASGQCLCAGMGPAMSGAASQLLHHYGPSEPVRRHFTQARLEILKGLRALLDERIERMQKQPSRGSKVTVD
jgi:hypothetical protein